MTFLFHELKNHLLNDSLSDWFDKISLISDDFQKDKENFFYKELKKQKNLYINDFLSSIRKSEIIYDYKDALTNDPNYPTTLTLSPPIRFKSMQRDASILLSHSTSSMSPMYLLLILKPFLFLECPWDPPTVYYAHPSNYSCVSQCPNTYFANI